MASRSDEHNHVDVPHYEDRLTEMKNIAPRLKENLIEAEFWPKKYVTKIDKISPHPAAGKIIWIEKDKIEKTCRTK